MEAGPMLDGLVAVKVMGWIKGPFAIGGRVYHWRDRERKLIIYQEANEYSQNVGYAFQVVDELKSRGAQFALMQSHDKGWQAIFISGQGQAHGAQAPTPALAICKAALAAVGEVVG